MRVISSARTIPGFAYFEEFTWLRKPLKYPALGDLTSEVKHVSVQSAFNLRALTTVDGPLPKRGPFAERSISVAPTVRRAQCQARPRSSMLYPINRIFFNPYILLPKSEPGYLLSLLTWPVHFCINRK